MGKLASYLFSGFLWDGMDGRLCVMGKGRKKRRSTTLPLFFFSFLAEVRDYCVSATIVMGSAFLLPASLAILYGLHGLV